MSQAGALSVSDQKLALPGGQRLSALAELTEPFRRARADEHHARAQEARSMLARAEGIGGAPPPCAPKDWVAHRQEQTGKLDVSRERCEHDGVLWRVDFDARGGAYWAPTAPGTPKPRATFERGGKLLFLGATRAERLQWVPATEALPEVIRRAKGRARGQLSRFATLENCGKSTVTVIAPDGTSKEHPIGCCHKLCPRCSPRLRRRVRARIMSAREELHRHAKRINMRLGGAEAFADRMVTLTVPHPPRPGDSDESVARERLQTLTRAIQKFWRRFVELCSWPFAKDDHRRELLAWARAIEWTPGNDGCGHPHCHVWVHSPFIPTWGAAIRVGNRLEAVATPTRPPDSRLDVWTDPERGAVTFRASERGVLKWVPTRRVVLGLKSLWADALREVGQVVEDVDSLVTDVRKWKVGKVEVETHKRSAIREAKQKSWGRDLLDYLTKGNAIRGAQRVAGGILWPASEEVLAVVFEELDGKRITQTGRSVATWYRASQAWKVRRAAMLERRQQRFRYQVSVWSSRDIAEAMARRPQPANDAAVSVDLSLLRAIDEARQAMTSRAEKKNPKRLSDAAWWGRFQAACDEMSNGLFGQFWKR